MGIIDTVKEVAELVQKIDNLDLMRKVLQLQTEAMAGSEREGAMRQRIRALEQEAELAGELRFEINRYYRKQEDREEDGPFCATC